MTLEQKITKLKDILSGYRDVAVAFSGGKDSYLVLDLALRVLGGAHVTAFFVETLFTAEADRQRLAYFQSRLDFRLEVVELEFDGRGVILSNPMDRCYHCKHRIFSTLLSRAREMGIPVLLDGTTHSDLDRYRPGLRALRQLEVVSPLELAGIDENDIQIYLHQVEPSIDPYYLTSSSCLATRFPYDTPLTGEALRKVDAIESYIVSRGIYPVRARYIDGALRIEIPATQFQALLDIRGPLVDLCKRHGVPFVSLDLEGIRSGIWDPDPKSKKES